MKRIIAFSIITVMCAVSAIAQERTVENRPYTDLRPFHFGVLVGTHLQDIEFTNVGPQVITTEDGSVDALVTCDQDRWDAGFNVGVLGEFRLGTYFAMRVAPAMYFGTKHFTFRNHKETLEDGRPIEQRQELKTAYVSCAFDLIFSAKRFNNHRPYMMLGLNPMLNLSNKDDDYLKMKKYDVFLEAGLGCDFYLPFFKLRPELKFAYGLTNCLDTDHGNHLKDKNMLKYTNSVNKGRSKMIVLTFYFE